MTSSSDIPKPINVKYPWRFIDADPDGRAYIENARTGVEREGALVEREGQVLYLEDGPEVDALSTEKAAG